MEGGLWEVGTSSFGHLSCGKERGKERSAEEVGRPAGVGWWPAWAESGRGPPPHGCVAALKMRSLACLPAPASPPSSTHTLLPRPCLPRSRLLSSRSSAFDPHSPSPRASGLVTMRQWRAAYAAKDGRSVTDTAVHATASPRSASTDTTGSSQGRQRSSRKAARAKDGTASEPRLSRATSSSSTMSP